MLCIVAAILVVSCVLLEVVLVAVYLSLVTLVSAIDMRRRSGIKLAEVYASFGKQFHCVTVSNQ